jgi:DNA invertase Pin-like site-specific DNA recombinase
MTTYGYARVSTSGQELAGQEAELTTAGRAKVYAEKIIRERLIKIGARVIEHVARIRVQLPTGCLPRLRIISKE